MIHATPGVIADGVRQTPAAIESGVSTTGEIIHATPGVLADGVRQAPGVVAGGVQTTGNVIAATPGAFVSGVRSIGNFGGAVFEGLARPFGK